MSPIDKNLAIGVTIAAVVIFAASFMPWGEVHGNLALPFLPEGHDNPFGALEVSQAINGWNSTLEIARIKLPNWLPAFAAIGLASLAWLKVRSLWSSPPALTYGLAGYGLLHSINFAGVLLRSPGSSVGIGVLLTIVGFVGMLAALVQNQRAGKRAPVPEIMA